MRKFIKAQCAANDYIYVFGKPWQKYEIISACKAKTGVGADGVIFINERGGVFCLDIFNSDGSEADFCGNACLTCAKILVERGCVKRFRFRLKTKAKTVEARVFLGGAQIGCAAPTEFFLSAGASELIKELGKDSRVIGAKVFNAGNLHLAIAAKTLNRGFISSVVKKVNLSGAFLDGINIEFFVPKTIKPYSPKTFAPKTVTSLKIESAAEKLNYGWQRKTENLVRAVVYERGSGYTTSCGSGALAVFECYNALIAKTPKLTVQYAGGALTVKKSKNSKTVYLRGKPKIVFEGELC